MWSIRILNGQQAGQIFNLKQGTNRVGRSPESDFQINSAGISKEHLEITALGDKVVVRDLQSSNGTFVNGVKIQNSLLHPGDKLSLHDIICEVIDLKIYRDNSVVTKTKSPRVSSITQTAKTPLTNQHAMSAITAPQLNVVRPQAYRKKAETSKNNYKDNLKNYFEKAFLPGIYKLTDIFEFRMVIIGFSAVFVLIVTLLAIVPMKMITTESIMTESKRRAMTVARALSQANEKVIRSGDINSFSTDLVLREEGIDDVYIVAKDGNIIAPPERAGTRPKEVGFINRIKGQTKEVATELGSGIIAASTPILIYDPDLQQNTAKAHVVIIYNAGNLAVDDGRVLSLFIQMLTIAITIGAGLFFLMYKLIEHPWDLLNKNLDQAIGDNKDHVNLSFSFPGLQKVVVNINSLLGRLHSGSQAPLVDYSSVLNLVNMIHGPAVVLDENSVIISINKSFEEYFSIVGAQQNISVLPDESIRNHMIQTLALAKGQLYTATVQNITIQDRVLHLNVQPIGEGKYFFITITTAESVGGAA